ncbi:MAG: transglutaminase family protein, partial [Candidatus Omnitrophica bacterium]|nr:transglutaminase family protein [Candidatus Omnitrophota bacterium]
EPHNVQDIFRNKYGDCKDQALLLVTMLRTAGIKAYPVLVSTKGHYGLYKDFPMMMFNHAIAATILDGKTVFMDPTAETCSFGDLPTPDHDREVLILGEYGYKIEKTPLFQASHNLLKQEMRIKIKEDGSIKAEKTTFTFGIYDQAQRYRALYTQPELIEEVIKEAIQSISIGAQLEEYKIENASDLDKPVVLSYKFNGPEYWTEAGNLRIMPQLAGLGTSLVAKD